MVLQTKKTVLIPLSNIMQFRRWFSNPIKLKTGNLNPTLKYSAIQTGIRTAYRLNKQRS